MNISEIEDYLNKDIKRSITNDVFPLVASSLVSREGGLFAIPRLIFAYVDFLGYLYEGRSSSQSAINFIRTYFGRVDSRYQEIGGLLYHIYRHGTIHEYEPKKIQLQDGTVVAWFVYKDSSKTLHLTGYFKDGVLWLRIHLNSLYTDLVSAIDLYIQDLKNNSSLRKKFAKARREIKNPENESTVRKKNYILDSDFNFIYALKASP